jgi:hypothetical protein
MPLLFPKFANPAEIGWGGPPVRVWTRIRNNEISIMQDERRPTGASAAVQGDRPTNYC